MTPCARSPRAQHGGEGTGASASSTHGLLASASGFAMVLTLYTVVKDEPGMLHINAVYKDIPVRERELGERTH